MANDTSRNRSSRRMGWRTIVLGVGLVLVLAVVLVFLFVPGVRKSLFPSREPSPTAVALEPSASPPLRGTDTPAPSPAAATGTAAVTISPIPTASPIPAAEFEDLLTQAEALTLRSQFEAAVVIYQHLVEAAPDDPRPQIGWAWTLILDHEAYQALDHAQRAVELDDGAGAAAVLARANIELGETSDALIQAQSAVELDPENATARAVLAEAYAQDGQLGPAVAEADRALALDVNSAEAHRIRGWLYQWADGDLVRAAGELQTAAGIQPDLWLRRYELGRLLLEVQNYDTALAVLQEAVALRPKAETYTALGQAAFWLEEYEPSQGWLEQAVAAGAQDAETFAFLAASLAHLGRCEASRGYAADALRLDAAHSLALEAEETCRVDRPPAPPTTTAEGTPEPTEPPAAPSSPAVLSGWIAFPDWNPARGKYDTYLAQAQDGGDRRLLVEEMHQPALSPDGQWLAVNGERPDHMNLFLSQVNGTALFEITNFLEDGQPAWSPDGERLAFASTRHGDKEFRVYIIDQVPWEGGRVDGRTLNYGPDDIRGEMPAWTSDGRIVYRACHLDSPRGECSGLGLFIVSADPGPQTPEEIASDPSATAPAVRGSRVVFSSNRDGNWEIYLVNLDGSGLRRLTRDAAADGLPVWSPDGRAIAFASDRGGVWAVWAVDPDGSNVRRLFDLEGGGLPFDWLRERISWVR